MAGRAKTCSRSNDGPALSLPPVSIRRDRHNITALDGFGIRTYPDSKKDNKNATFQYHHLDTFPPPHPLNSGARPINLPGLPSAKNRSNIRDGKQPFMNPVALYRNPPDGGFPENVFRLPHKDDNHLFQSDGFGLSKNYKL